jgi:hypothetical protein
MFTLAAEGLPMLQKDDAEHPVPEPLRSTFRQIAEAFVAGDYQLRDHPIAGVRPVEPDTAKWIAESISAYGDTLAPLDEQTWERSSIGGWTVIGWRLLTSPQVPNR